MAGGCGGLGGECGGGGVLGGHCHSVAAAPRPPIAITAPVIDQARHRRKVASVVRTASFPRRVSLKRTRSVTRCSISSSMRAKPFLWTFALDVFAECCGGGAAGWASKVDDEVRALAHTRSCPGARGRRTGRAPSSKEPSEATPGPPLWSDGCCSKEPSEATPVAGPLQSDGIGRACLLFGGLRGHRDQ